MDIPEAVEYHDFFNECGLQAIESCIYCGVYGHMLVKPMYFLYELGHMLVKPMIFSYELYKPVQTGVQTVGRRVQTVQTIREENIGKNLISLDLGLYGLYTFTNSLYSGLYGLYTQM